MILSRIQNFSRFSFVVISSLNIHRYASAHFEIYFLSHSRHNIFVNVCCALVVLMLNIVVLFKITSLSEKTKPREAKNSLSDIYSHAIVIGVFTLIFFNDDRELLFFPFSTCFFYRSPSVSR